MTWTMTIDRANKLMQEELARMRGDLERLVEELRIATGVLHNVGNVLNSVNVSANLLAECVEKSKGAELARVTALLREHESDLGNFVTGHPQGKHLIGYLESLDRQLQAERQAAAGEIGH